MRRSHSFVLGVAATVWLSVPAPRPAGAASPLTDLLGAARGTSPMLCALAAHSLGNGFGGLYPPYPVVASASVTVREAVMPHPRAATTVTVSVTFASVGVYVIAEVVVEPVIVPPSICHAYVHPEHDATDAVRPAAHETGCVCTVMAGLGVQPSRPVLKIGSIFSLASPALPKR